MSSGPHLVYHGQPFTDEQRHTVLEAVEKARTLPHVVSYERPNLKAAALAAIADDWLHGCGHRRLWR